MLCKMAAYTVLIYIKKKTGLLQNPTGLYVDYKFVNTIRRYTKTSIHRSIFIIILLHAVYALYNNNHCQIYRPHIIIMYIFSLPGILYIFFRNSDNPIALVRVVLYTFHIKRIIIIILYRLYNIVL